MFFMVLHCQFKLFLYNFSSLIWFTALNQRLFQGFYENKSTEETSQQLHERKMLSGEQSSQSSLVMGVFMCLVT